jgi:hypothetical protein
MQQHEDEEEEEEPEDFRRRQQQKHDMMFSVGAITGYLLLGIVFYGADSQWSAVSSMYFAFATVTTVGYGDFNGSGGVGTMLFTALYGFIGVGMIGLAIGEISEAVQAVREKAKRKSMQQMSEELLAEVQAHFLGVEYVSAHTLSTWERLNSWTKKGFLRRLIRIFIPLLMIGFIGALLLLNTEPDDSDIMTQTNPLMAALYVSVITSLSVGYGDFYPTTVAGRGCFILFIPISVMVILQIIDELNSAVKYLRTTQFSEIVDIRELLDVGQVASVVNQCEYVLYMLKSTGQVDLRVCEAFEAQFECLDASGDGQLDERDFPPGIGLKKTHSFFNGVTITNIEVCAFDGSAIDQPEIVFKKGSLKERARNTAADKVTAAKHRRKAAVVGLHVAHTKLAKIQDKLADLGYNRPLSPPPQSTIRPLPSTRTVFNTANTVAV